MAEQPLIGKVALVTGAGSNRGMGRVMSIALANAGARIAMMDIDGASLERTVNEVRELAGDDAATPIVGDTSSSGDAERAVAEALDAFGALHILVNNAGIRLSSGPYADVKGGSFWDVPPDAWERIFSINANGPFFMAHAAINPMLRQGWGRIIGVTTSFDTMTRGGNLPYGPTKAAHEAFVAAISQELEGTGVTANVLIPGGATNTNFLPDDLPYDRESLIQPEVMAEPVAWLASAEADGLNGRRIIASDWDTSLPIDQRLQKASAPVAWPQLGRQAPSPR